MVGKLIGQFFQGNRIGMPVHILVKLIGEAHRGFGGKLGPILAGNLNKKGGKQGVTGKGLSGIQLVFTDCDFSVIFAADGVILSLIGIIKIEEIMPVKGSRSNSL